MNILEIVAKKAKKKHEDAETKPMETKERVLEAMKNKKKKSLAEQINFGGKYKS